MDNHQNARLTVHSREQIAKARVLSKRVAKRCCLVIREPFRECAIMSSN
ncbi:hypothetical protein AciX8_2455 [Granulicella mallensis MP5ACTX8]|uniref:Uncharacterized protein n=1 Tax=Granulicella mallensis (strain ATCC BAA-1857 / DSM 23137 / MP5ACTX8) TaxID=682795 RepID=G8NY98_GRAMM|nr:hypothetical protein AciX8_2455 [Granulicella mallensis MP5ACTX8]